MRDNLAKELTSLLAKRENEELLIMRNDNSLDYSDIIKSMTDLDNGVLVTNLNYREECCDYQVICFKKVGEEDYEPFVIYSIDASGTVLYPFRDTHNPLEAEELIEELKTWIERIKIVYLVDTN